MWRAARAQVESLSPAAKPIFFFANPVPRAGSFPFFLVRAAYFLFHNQTQCYSLYRAALVSNRLNSREVYDPQSALFFAFLP